MPCRTVVPDRQIILAPLETNLGVVVLSHQLLYVSHPEYLGSGVIEKGFSTYIEQIPQQ